MKDNWKMVLLIALILSGCLSLFASGSPDGLEKVAEETGFLNMSNSLLAGLAPDYAVPGIANENVATSLAGIVGAFLVFGVLLGIGRVLCITRFDKK